MECQKKIKVLTFKGRGFQSRVFTVTCRSKEEYVAKEIRNAIDYYNGTVSKLADRVLAKGLNVEKMKLTTSFLDPNIETFITDGNIKLWARTIIASGVVQKPHYRYLVTNQK